MLYTSFVLTFVSFKGHAFINPSSQCLSSVNLVQSGVSFGLRYLSRDFFGLFWSGRVDFLDMRSSRTVKARESGVDQPPQRPLTEHRWGDVKHWAHFSLSINAHAEKGTGPTVFIIPQFLENMHRNINEHDKFTFNCLPGNSPHSLGFAELSYFH